MRKTDEVDWQMASVVVIDLEGSTEMTIESPQEASAVLMQYLDQCANLATRMGALTVRTGDNDLSAIFPTPTQAAAFAVKARSLKITNRRPRGKRMENDVHVRIGIATGDLAVGRQVVGLVAKVAARLAATAGPDTLVCDAASWALSDNLPGRWRAATRRTSIEGLPRVLSVHERSLANGTARSSRSAGSSRALVHARA